MIFDSIKMDLFIGLTATAFLGWLIGLFLGGAAGYGIAAISFSLLTRSKLLQRYLILIPWRTPVMALIILFWVPFWATGQFGLGFKSGTVSVAFQMFILSSLLFSFTFLNHWRQTSLEARLAALSRTLAGFSVVLAAHYGIFGSGGIGTLAIANINQPDDQSAFSGWIVIITALLAIDLTLSLVEFTLWKYLDTEPR